MTKYDLPNTAQAAPFTTRELAIRLFGPNLRVTIPPTDLLASWSRHGVDATHILWTRDLPEHQTFGIPIPLTRQAHDALLSHHAGIAQLLLEAWSQLDCDPFDWSITAAPSLVQLTFGFGAETASA